MPNLMGMAADKNGDGVIDGKEFVEAVEEGTLPNPYALPAEYWNDQAFQLNNLSTEERTKLFKLVSSGAMPPYPGYEEDLAASETIPFGQGPNQIRSAVQQRILQARKWDASDGTTGLTVDESSKFGQEC
jgi:hypothetical protein